jgi:uncharacterized membrane protein YfcA
MLPMNWFLLGGTLACAGFVQGLTGFGFGLVSMSLMPLFINIKQAAAISTVFSLLATVTTFVRHARDYNWRQGCVFLGSLCVGVPIGVYLLDRTSEPLLVHVLGVIMVALAARELVWNRKMEAVPAGWTIPLGVFSGGLSGAFNLGGTPTAAYAYSNPWTRGQIMAYLQVTITVSCALRMICYTHFGYFQEFSWTRAALLAVPLYAAIAGGHACLQKISPQQMRRCVFVFIAVVGVYYLLLHQTKHA